MKEQHTASSICISFSTTIGLRSRASRKNCKYAMLRSAHKTNLDRKPRIVLYHVHIGVLQRGSNVLDIELPMALLFLLFLLLQEQTLSRSLTGNCKASAVLCEPPLATLATAPRNVLKGASLMSMSNDDRSRPCTTSFLARTMLFGT